MLAFLAKYVRINIFIIPSKFVDRNTNQHRNKQKTNNNNRNDECNFSTTCLNTTVNTNGLSQLAIVSYILCNTIPLNAPFFIGVEDGEGALESELVLVLIDILVVVKCVLIEGVESMYIATGMYMKCYVQH